MRRILFGMIPGLLALGCSEGNHGFRKDGWITHDEVQGCTHVAQDPLGGIWVAHEGGASHLDAGGTWCHYTPADGMVDLVFEVHADPAGGKWFVGDGISYLDDNGTPSLKTDDAWVTYPLPADLLVLDPGGGKWLGHLDGGVDWWDDGGTPMDVGDDLLVHFDWFDGMTDTGVLCIAPEPGVGVWFGHCNGVDFLDPGTSIPDKGDDAWANLNVDDGLCHPWVSAIAIDPGGLKWFGTFDDTSVLDDGGTPLDPGDDLWKERRVKNRPVILNEIRTIAIDPEGIKWMGTRDIGICRLDDRGAPFRKRNDRVRYSRKRNGLSSNAVEHILIDDAGGKWVATGLGLDHLE